MDHSVLLTALSATALAAGIKARQFSCKEVMAAYLAKIEDVNPSLNAIVQQLDPEQAMALAEAADRQLHNGQPIGQLHGVPITIKDHLKVKGFKVSRGCLGFKDNVCDQDASLVARLKAQGAIVIGITNMPEFGPAFETDNDIYGQTKNPYDHSKTPGGSSGGEAAILAAGGSALGIGSDAGGSIRLPAHFSGIAGIKPTQNLLPCTGNVPMDGGLIMQFGTLGPMARFVEDLQTTLPLLMGGDGIDPYCMPAPILKPSPAIKSMRIGYIYDTSVCQPTADTVNVLKQAVTLLAEQGANVSQIDFLDIGHLGMFVWESFFMGGDQGQLYLEMLKNVNVTTPSPILQRFLDAAAHSKRFDACELRKRFFEADQLRMQALQAMQPYDALITPVCATPAKPHGTTQDNLFDFVYTLTFNLLRWPACVVRCGTSEDHLPIGLQIAAKPWEDFTTLTVAQCLEEHLGGWQSSDKS